MMMMMIMWIVRNNEHNGCARGTCLRDHAGHLPVRINAEHIHLTGEPVQPGVALIICTSKHILVIIRVRSLKVPHAPRPRPALASAACKRTFNALEGRGTRKETYHEGLEENKLTEEGDYIQGHLHRERERE